MDASQEPADWIAPDEPAAYEIVNTAGASRIVLVCDHASARIPRRLGTLGLDALDLDDHIAWDVGSGGVARRLSETLDAPLILAGYSRLVVDNNRPLSAPDAFAAHSDGRDIPGNRSLTETERKERAASFYWPYHDAIHRTITARMASAVPLVVSIHSFTPVHGGAGRPWDVGLLYRWDRRGAALALNHLGADTDLCVGDNEPYRIAIDEDYTIPIHVETRGLPYMMFEIRQDQIDSPSGIAAWAERLASLLRETASHPDLDHRCDGATDCREPRYAEGYRDGTG